MTFSQNITVLSVEPSSQRMAFSQSEGVSLSLECSGVATMHLTQVVTTPLRLVSSTFVVIDSFESSSATSALSANRGRLLNERINSLDDFDYAAYFESLLV